MRYGLPLSIFFHALMVAVVLIGWPSFSKPIAEKSVEVPVEIVRFDEATNPPPGQKRDQRDERTPDDEKTTGKSRSADGGKTRPVTRPETAPERPPEPEVKKPAETPDDKTATPKTEQDTAAPKAPEKRPEPPKQEVKKPAEAPDTATPRAERDTAAPKAPEKPPEPPKQEVKRPAETPDTATPRTERDVAAPTRPAVPPQRQDVTLATPKSLQKAPATPESEPKKTEIKKPPAPPEPERHDAALRPPPRVTTPEPSTAPESPDAERDAALPKRPAAPPKTPPNRQIAALRPPAATDKAVPKEPKQEQPQIKSQPSFRPEPSEAEKKKEDAPAIKSRPSFRAEKAPQDPRENKSQQPAPTPSKLDSIFRSLDRERKAPQEADADRTARDQRRGAPEHKPGTPLTVSEIDAIKRQIRRCWSADAAAKELDELVVTIEVWMNEDGTVREARIAPETRIRGPAHRAAAERALRAVQNERCQPYRLPPEKYARWRQMKLDFDPSDN